MEGLIGINNSWFKSRIPIFIGDVNTLVDSGLYGITPEATNTPTEKEYGLLSVSSSGNNSRIMYLYVSVNGAVLVRAVYDKSDSGWKRIALT